MGGIKTSELNALERELLRVTEWNLCVSSLFYNQYPQVWWDANSNDGSATQKHCKNTTHPLYGHMGATCKLHVLPYLHSCPSRTILHPSTPTCAPLPQRFQTRLFKALDLPLLGARGGTGDILDGSPEGSVVSWLGIKGKVALNSLKSSADHCFLSRVGKADPTQIIAQSFHDSKSAILEG